VSKSLRLRLASSTEVGKQSRSSSGLSSRFSSGLGSRLSSKSGSRFSSQSGLRFSSQSNSQSISRPSSFARLISHSIFRSFCDQEGSAVIEFVVLALPLLLPLTVYLNEVHQNSIINSDLHNLARQSARAFITSNDESLESPRMQTILNLFESKILAPAGISEVPTLNIECSTYPCLTPNTEVKVTASITHTHKNFSGIFRFISAPSVQFSASDTQIVDAWR